MSRRAPLMQPSLLCAVDRLVHHQLKQHPQRIVQRMLVQCCGLPKRPIAQPMQALVGVAQVRLVAHRVPTTRACQQTRAALATCALQLPTIARPYRLASSQRSNDQRRHHLRSHEWSEDVHSLHIQACPSRATRVIRLQPVDLHQQKYQVH